MRNKIFSVSLTVIPVMFLFFALFSCKVNVDYEIYKKDANYSDTYTNKDAYSIFYYKQPVTGESDFSAWERDTQNDTLNTYVPAGTSVSTLNNKAYEGFIFAGIIQNDTVINVLYKRGTIKYEFYDRIADTKPLFVISGLYGMKSIKPICNDTDDAYFNSWHTKNQVPYTQTFCINSDSNTVNDVSTTKWYASWTGKSSVLGVGMNLNDVGDILLRDGSVVPYSMLSGMSSAQKEETVGVLVSNTYDPKTGDNTKGDVRLIAGLKKFSGEWITESASSLLASQGFKTSDTDGKTNMETIFNLDPNLRKSTIRNSSVLLSYDYDINVGLASDYKNEWYLPASKEFKLLLTTELVQIYKDFGFEVYNNCWTSTTSPNKQGKFVGIKLNSEESPNMDKTNVCYIIPFRQIP